MQHDEPGSKLARAAHEASNLSRGHMGELDPRDDADLQVRLGLPGEFHHSGNQIVEIRRVRVVGDSHRAVARLLGPPNQLRGAQRAVAREGVRVQVDHRAPPSGPESTRK